MSWIPQWPPRDFQRSTLELRLRKDNIDWVLNWLGQNIVLCRAIVESLRYLVFRLWSSCWFLHRWMQWFTMKDMLWGFLMKNGYCKDCEKSGCGLKTPILYPNRPIYSGSDYCQSIIINELYTIDIPEDKVPVNYERLDEGYGLICLQFVAENVKTKEFRMNEKDTYWYIWWLAKTPRRLW